MNISKKLVLCLLLCSGLATCVETRLSNQATEREVFELAAANRKPIHVEIIQEHPQESLGHQYLLIGIPFGYVDSGNAGLLIQRAVYRKLVLRGFTPLIGQKSGTGFGAQAPVLSIYVGSLQASAYDFLVTRRLNCSMNVSAKLQRAGLQREAHASGSFERFGAFAFDKEMSGCFTQALDEAFDRLLSELRI